MVNILGLNILKTDVSFSDRKNQVYSRNIIKIQDLSRDHMVSDAKSISVVIFYDYNMQAALPYLQSTEFKESREAFCEVKPRMFELSDPFDINNPPATLPNVFNLCVLFSIMDGFTFEDFEKTFHDPVLAYERSKFCDNEKIIVSKVDSNRVLILIFGMNYKKSIGCFSSDREKYLSQPMTDVDSYIRMSFTEIKTDLDQ